MTAERFKVRRCCFVKFSYQGNRYISAVPKVKPAGRERIWILNKPACAIFATYLLNVNRWIDKKLMHDTNLKNEDTSNIMIDDHFFY